MGYRPCDQTHPVGIVRIFCCPDVEIRICKIWSPKMTGSSCEVHKQYPAMVLGYIFVVEWIGIRNLNVCYQRLNR